MMDYAHLDKPKRRLEGLRPLPPAVLANFHEDLVLRWTYNSNAIEGNILTLQETKVALEDVTIGKKTLLRCISGRWNRGARRIYQRKMNVYKEPGQ